MRNKRKMWPKEKCSAIWTWVLFWMGYIHDVGWQWSQRRRQPSRGKDPKQIKCWCSTGRPNKYTDCANFNENIDHLIKEHFSYWVFTDATAAAATTTAAAHTITFGDVISIVVSTSPPALPWSPCTATLWKMFSAGDSIFLFISCMYVGINVLFFSSSPSSWSSSSSSPVVIFNVL